jgi:hypothetical protein
MKISLSFAEPGVSQIQHLLGDQVNFEPGGGGGDSAGLALKTLTSHTLRPWEVETGRRYLVREIRGATLLMPGWGLGNLGWEFTPVALRLLH